MNRKQLENLFEANGLSHFQLKDKEDLLKVFGIKIEQLEGFETLSDENKELFTNFLINFYNAQGVNGKLCLEPVSIYFVRKNELIVKLNDNDDDFWNWFSTKFYILDKNSNEIKLFKHYKENELQYLHDTDAMFRENIEFFLRFDYKWNLDEVVNEWLHVTDEHSWY